MRIRCLETSSGLLLIPRRPGRSSLLKVLTRCPAGTPVQDAERNNPTPEGHYFLVGAGRGV